MSREAKKEVERFLREGRKIAAIKHLSDTYGFSLSQSKTLVEAVEEQGAGKPEDLYSAGPAVSADETLKGEIRQLLASGKKIEAINLAKETLRVRLRGAKVLVEDIESGMTRDDRPHSRQGRPALRGGPGGILMGAFVGLGLLFMGAATYLYLRQSQSIQQSDLIKGKVVSLRQNTEGMSAPVIEFEWHGTKRMYSSTTYSSPPAFSVDEVVPVYVNRQDPGTITVDTFSERWLIIFILGIIGAFFVGIPMLIVYFGTPR